MIAPDPLNRRRSNRPGTPPWLSISVALTIGLVSTARTAARAEPPRDAARLRIAATQTTTGTQTATETTTQAALDHPNQPCVLLKNDNVLFGHAHQLGEYVIVRTGPMDELRLARSEVACWAPSLSDLYRYRLDQRSKPNLQSHLHDASWCLRYDLLDEAAVEIRAAKAIAPNHPAVQLVEGQWQRRRNPVQSAPIKTASYSQAAAPADVGTTHRVDPMVLKAFASEVQPALINRCGRCHDQGSNQRWRLTIPSAGGRPTAPLTHDNLAAVLEFVDGDDPQQSLLLTKAISPHGGTDAPLGVRNAKAIDSLRRWLAMLQGSQTGASSSAGGQSPPAAELDRMQDQKTGSTTAAGATIAQVSFETNAAGQSSPPIKTANDSNSPQRLPTVANPFDPSLFNRRFHRHAQ